MARRPRSKSLIAGAFTLTEQAIALNLFPRVRVIHGHGAGILRRGVREFLKGHPHVAGIDEAPQNEGGQGATLVELRQ